MSDGDACFLLGSRFHLQKCVKISSVDETKDSILVKNQIPSNFVDTHLMLEVFGKKRCRLH